MNLSLIASKGHSAPWEPPYLRRAPSRAWTLMLAITLAASVACAQEQRQAGAANQPDKGNASVGNPPAGDTGEDRLLRELRRVFQKSNPKLARVGVLELRSWYTTGPRIVVAWSIVPDFKFRGDFKDEMFGVFVVNDSLSHVERIVDIFSTPRWFDYEVRIGRLTADSVEVIGQGATYSDEPMRKSYKWR